MKDIYRSFYTKSDSIVDSMIESLDLNDGQYILEPSAGDGIFIDKIINEEKKNIKIDAFEINPEALTTLKTKYDSNNRVNIFEDDTLTNLTLTLYADQGGIYDRVIANPPYGGWQDCTKRKKLKKLYNNFYTKETYTLFLHRAINVTKPSGKIVFIIPDTFLNLHMHKKFRKFMLLVTKIKELKLFNSSFFPDVDFGYSGLCIITLEKCTSKNEALKNKIKIYKGFSTVNELLDNPKEVCNVFQQVDIYNNIDHTFFMTNDKQITFLINNHETKIVDIADCVTGFYSGNNKKYLKVKSKSVVYSKGYDVANEDRIISKPYMVKNIIDGVNGKKHLIPIVKGGNKYFHKETKWYVDWRRESIKDYKESNKARFQNSQYYFRDWGLGVPMVKSTYISAAALENRLFDQSIVGIFPHNKYNFYYLLALFNSPTFSNLIQLINPSANNSANYLKKLPVIFPNDDMLDKINSLTKNILKDLRYNHNYLEETHKEINSYIDELYS